MRSPVLLVKAITTIRPYFFDAEFTGTYTHFDAHLGHRVTSVELGYYHWTQQLDEARLRGILTKHVASDVWTSLNRHLDGAAVREIVKVKSLLGEFSERMLSAEEIIFCFRVLERCTAVASLDERAFELHLGRGIVSQEYDPYSLTEILRAAAKAGESALGRYLAGLLPFEAIGCEPAAIVINLRNDGELIQAFLVAALIKQKWPNAVRILDSSGANEQYNFGEWVQPLTSRRDAVSQYFDYFLPRQDYGASLRALLELIMRGSSPALSGCTSNIIAFSSPAATAIEPAPVRTVAETFHNYIQALPVFRTAGHRTIVARLSPTKCHWAACKFCTINSQHLMPRGLAIFDDHYQRNFESLLLKIRRDNIQSLILMDEALHPNVLLTFAERVLSSGLSIVYRARCRFTNDLTPEVCKTIYASGCRYLGLGLEAASPRVNKLVNKHMGEPIDYDGVLQSLENAGIRMHIYAILGFPTETREEIAATRDFLIDNIKRHRYLTVSANLFHLMRGSGIFHGPKEFNIEAMIDPGDIALVLQFRERERDANLAFSERSVQEIFRAEFLPDSEHPETAQALWHFIDQTGIFYVQKVASSKNPFHALAEARSTVIPADFVERRYEPACLFWLDDLNTADCAVLCDWGTLNCAQVPVWLREFLVRFDHSRSLRANVNQFLEPRRAQEGYSAFRALIGGGFYRSVQTAVAPMNDVPAQRIFRGTAEVISLEREPMDGIESFLVATAVSEAHP